MKGAIGCFTNSFTTRPPRIGKMLSARRLAAVPVKRETPPVALDPKTRQGPQLVLAPSDGGKRVDSCQGVLTGGPQAGEGPSKAYPAGKRLTTSDVQRSISHAPQGLKTRKPIWWDAACHIGCSRTNCPHVHEQLLPLNKLDYTVVMQVLRRGRLKNGPKVNLKDVDGRIAQLRAQHRTEQDGKAAQGKALAKAKAKAKTRS